MNTQTSYKKPILLILKDCGSKFLKSSFLGRVIYPIAQCLWRCYSVPMKRRRLARHGAEALARLHNLLIDNKIMYYCDYGTLLGIVRDKGFMPHDDDIDISILPNSIAPREVLAVFMAAGYGFVHGFNYQGRVLEFTVADVSGITIDLFFPTEIANDCEHINGYQVVWYPDCDYPNNQANSVIEYTFKKALGLKNIQILGVDTNIPQNYEDVLTSEYGRWEVPDSKFDTVKDRVHNLVADFAYRILESKEL